MLHVVRPLSNDTLQKTNKHKTPREKKKKKTPLCKPGQEVSMSACQHVSNLACLQGWMVRKPRRRGGLKEKSSECVLFPALVICSIVGDTQVNKVNKVPRYTFVKAM
jgi:hypothetical protein